MAIALLADIHLGISTKTIRTNDQGKLQVLLERTFEEMVEKLIDRSPDIVVIAGDVFDEKNPKGRLLEFFGRKLSELSEVSEVIIVAGNHDVDLKALDSYLRVFKIFKNVHVFDISRVREIIKNPRTIEIAGYEFLILPYPGPRRLFKKVEAAYTRALMSLDYDYIIGHRSVDSRRYSDDEFVMSSSLFKSLALLGHIHKRAMGERFIYPGAPIAAPVSHFIDRSIAPAEFSIPIIENGRVVEEIRYEGIRLVNLIARNPKELQEVYRKLSELQLKKAVIRVRVDRSRISESDVDALLKAIERFEGYVPKIDTLVRIRGPVSVIDFVGAEEGNLEDEILSKISLGNLRITAIFRETYKELEDQDPETIAEEALKRILKYLGVEEI